jgi:hypothetical protein
VSRERRSPFSLPICTPTSLACTVVRTSTLPNSAVFNPMRISAWPALFTICAHCSGPAAAVGGASTVAGRLERALSGTPAEVWGLDFDPALGKEDGCGTLTCAEGPAIVNAGDGAVGKESAAATAALGESLCCCEFGELPSESFFDGAVELAAGSWALGMLTDVFAGWCWAGLILVETAGLFSAVDIVCKFAAAGIAGTLLEVP